MSFGSYASVGRESEPDIGKLYVKYKNVLKGFTIFMVALFLFEVSTYSVKVGDVGLVLRLDSLNRTVGNGFHFKLPIIEKVRRMEVQTTKVDTTSSAASSDLQQVTVQTAFNYHLDANRAADLYTSVGIDYEKRLVIPAIHEAVKASTAKFTAEELITKRAEVKGAIKTYFATNLEPYGLVTDGVNIVDLDFSESFNRAIEAKVTAEQNALASENKLKQVEFEAEQQIASAEGKAKAMEIEASALRSNPELLELRFIEKWDGSLPTVVSSGNIMDISSLIK